MNISNLERRKLFVYTAMLIAGILAGYFALEMINWVAGIAWFIVIGIFARTSANSTRFVLCCVGFLVAGFMLFTLEYIESESNPMNIEDVEMIRGNVINYSIKDEKIYIILDNTYCEVEGNWIYLGKIQATGSNELVDNPADYIGQRLIITGKLSRPEKAANPACFDYRIYLKTRGIYYLFRIYDVEDAVRVDNLRMKHIRNMIGLRDGFLSIFEDDDTRGFVKGIIFGDKSDIDEESRDLFNINGTGHILAVSGLHVGFLYTLIRFISGRKRNKTTVAITIAVLLLYGEMTMWSASTIRAVLVLSMCLMARHVRRPFDLLTSVSAAAFVILAINPYQLFNTGFQLSFMALISIAFLCKPLSVIFGQSLAMMLSVQIGIVPLSAFLFNRINLMSIFINIPVIALAGIIVPFYLIMLLVYMTLGRVPGIAIIIAEGLNRMMIKLNQVFALNGGFSSQIISIDPAIIIACYLLILFVFSEWFRVKYFRREWREAAKGAVCILLASVIIFTCTHNKFLHDNVVFVSVGQGSCIHLRTPSGKNILIDGGGVSESNYDYNVGEKILQPYLLKNGVARIDLALATHMDADHYKGLEELSELRMVNKLITNRDGYAAGDIIYKEKGFQILVLAPLHKHEYASSTTEENENSLVLRIDFEDYSLIATGDIGKSTEQEIIDYWERSNHGIELPSNSKSALDVDILAVPHHGSKNSSSDEFIEAISPEIAVIQVGKDNMYGHPAPETIARYERYGVRIYRNDIQGAVGIGRNMKIDTMK